jgi:Kef-type K+ transport system membrane component KefB
MLILSLGHFDWALTLTFLLLSTGIETISVYLATRFAGESKLTSWNFSIAMNTRGGPGIVLATIAFEHGIYQ